MSNELILEAFEKRLTDWANAQTPAIPIAYMNKNFTPPATRYIRAFLLPAATQSLTLDGVNRDYSGVFQVSFVMPKNEGGKPAAKLADSIDAAFPVSFLYKGLRIWMTKPMSTRPSYNDDDGRYVLPVSGNYRAETV